MNAYIVKFLREVNTLIIPNFGALTITDAATGEILFLPYLKYDDGKLVNFIAEQKGISTDEAKELIAESILGIQKKLELGENYPIESLGSFSKSKTGEIEFISDHFQKTPVSETDEATNTLASAALKSESEPQKSTPEIENQGQIVLDEPAIIPLESEQEAILPEPKLESEVIDLDENSIEIAEESIALETLEHETLEEKIVLTDEIEVNDAPI